MPLAALPMYDLEELRASTDALWAAIAARLLADGVCAPATLTRGMELAALWTDPDLLLAQTCGYPLVTTLKDRVRLLATPCYQVPGCAGAFYRSAVVVRAADPARDLADLRGRRAAINDLASNSGMNLLRQAILPFAVQGTPFFRASILTGGHAASVRAVGEGAADAAAIDCVTWAHLQHFRPAETGGLRVLAWTAASPGLPLITSLGTDAPTLLALRRALDAVAGDPALLQVRSALRLQEFRAPDSAAYETIKPRTRDSPEKTLTCFETTAPANNPQSP